MAPKLERGSGRVHPAPAVSPPVRGGSGGSRQLLRRAPPVRGLDAEQRVQAEARDSPPNPLLRLRSPILGLLQTTSADEDLRRALLLLNLDGCPEKLETLVFVAEKQSDEWTQEYSQTALNKFNVIPESIPDWIFDFMPSRGGYFIGNGSPARMDFRWFCLGNFIAILSSLATREQAEAILDLVEERWEELIGQMPMKICYPAMENQEWQIVTGCDPKNTRWSYHNGGSWPGATVAQYCADRFHTEFRNIEGYHNNLDNAVRVVFLRMDEQLRQHDDRRAEANPRRFRFSLLPGPRSTAPCVKEIPYFKGSIACVALISGTRIIVANVGDSRCVLSRNGRAMDLSTDHKPNLPDESQRIQNAGGEVKWVPFSSGGPLSWGCHRVNGILAMSRSLGDFHFKDTRLRATDQMMTCNPDVRSEDVTHDTDFLLIASDGIWDVLSSQDAVDFVSRKLDNGTTDLRAICENLLTRCDKSRDNATVILVQFKHAGRLPHPPPPASVPVPVVNPTGDDNSSVVNPDARAEVKAETGSEKKEDEPPPPPPPPVSTMPTVL